MNSSSLRLKNARNWFAAGVEVQQALELLTDGAFKVFMYICLNAERHTGILHTTQVELARTLKKSNGTIRKYLGELERAGVCRNNFSNNPVTRDRFKSPHRIGLTKRTRFKFKQMTRALRNLSQR